jgi:hypothetical protein
MYTNRKKMLAKTASDALVMESQGIFQQNRYWLTSIVPSFVPNFIVRGFSYAYYALITRPLEYFYFVGPIWQNIPPHEICNAMTDNKLGSNFWMNHPEACMDILRRGFTSWDTKVTTSIYFLVLGFSAVYITANCCFLPKILRSVCKQYRRKRKKKLEESTT